MKKLNTIFALLILTICLIPCHFASQTTEMEKTLTGLAKLKDEDRPKFQGKVNLDFNTVSFFSPEGKSLKGANEVLPYLQDQEKYIYDIYHNGSDIKAIVFKPNAIESELPLENLTEEMREAIKGLKILTVEEVESQKGKTKDISNILIFSPGGKRLQGMEIMPYFGEEKENYTYDLYENDKKEIKVVFLKHKNINQKESITHESKENSEEFAKPFTVKDINNKTYSTKELKGKILVLNFWFMKCKPCLLEIPELNNLTYKYKGKDVVFLGLTFDKTIELKNSFQKKHNFKYKLIPDASSVIADYDVKDFPTHIIIDQNSKIKYRSSGFNKTKSIKELEENIDNLLK